MLIEEIEITNKLGLHARASAKFVETASKFDANIEIEKDNKKVNGKSIMGIMMLAAAKGSIIKLHIDGNEQQQASEALTTLIKNKFDEEE